MAERKRMTQKEKTQKERIKKELQAEGILPPDKPRLNRKKFIEEAKAEWSEKGDYLNDIPYLMWAVSEMLEKRDKNLNLSLEAVGVAKVLKLAIRRREFMEEKLSEGETIYRSGELIDAVMDIYEA